MEVITTTKTKTDHINAQSKSLQEEKNGNKARFLGSLVPRIFLLSSVSIRVDEAFVKCWCCGVE